jgi:acylphosphatase
VTKRYIISWRVQGVGFRWFVELEARTIGVRGWVRNNEDGTVEVLASGTEEQLETLRRRLSEGPRASRVDQVQEFEAEHEASPSSFQIEGAW